VKPIRSTGEMEFIRDGDHVAQVPEFDIWVHVASAFCLNFVEFQ
jgi:hypothetical protein